MREINHTRPGNWSCAFRVYERGMTLIEMAAVLAIMALLVGLAVPTVSGITAVNLKNGAGNVSGTVRYMFNHASMSGSYCRLKFDLQGQTYSAECSDRPIYLSKKAEIANFEGERVDVEEEAKKSRFGLSEEEIKERMAMKPVYSNVRTNLLKSAKLPDGVRFDGVWTGHQSERFTKGSGYLYFFPGGYTERALIYIADEEGRVYTVIVNPLSGKTRVEPKFIEPTEKAE